MPSTSSTSPSYHPKTLTLIALTPTMATIITAAPASPATKAGDLEAGDAAVLYPNMAEDPQLRWAFIRKVYTIIALQFLLTAGIASAIALVRPVPAFLLSGTKAAWAVFITVTILPLIALVPMLMYRKKHPVNLVLLGVYTICISSSIGVLCATIKGSSVLQALIMTTCVVIGLTIYTFWAARRGDDFAFLSPFLFSCLIVLLGYSIMQCLFPSSNVIHTIYGFLATVLFSAFLVHDTDTLIKRHSYNEYVYAAISLYMDVINIFMGLLSLSIFTE